MTQMISRRPFPPGGTMDPVARLAQDQLSREVGQPVVVEHPPGGGTVVGPQEAFRAPADGHTMIMVANSPETMPVARPQNSSGAGAAALAN